MWNPMDRPRMAVGSEGDALGWRQELDGLSDWKAQYLLAWFSVSTLWNKVTLCPLYYVFLKKNRMKTK